MALNDEGGCAVDWSWLFGERIVKVTSSLDLLTITFASGLEWQISAKLTAVAPASTRSSRQASSGTGRPSMSPATFRICSRTCSAHRRTASPER